MLTTGRISNQSKLLDTRLAQCTGDDKRRKLQPVPRERDAIHGLRKHTGEVTEEGLTPFSHQLFVRAAPAISTALGVLFPSGGKLTSICRLGCVLRSIISGATVHKERRRRLSKPAYAGRLRLHRMGSPRPPSKTHMILTEARSRASKLDGKGASIRPHANSILIIERIFG